MAWQTISSAKNFAVKLKSIQKFNLIKYLLVVVVIRKENFCNCVQFAIWS